MEQFTLCQPKTNTLVDLVCLLAVSAACFSPNSAVKVGDQLQPHCCLPLSSTHTASLVLVKQALVRDLWMWSTPAARRAGSRPPVRTEHTPIDLTHTLFILLISGARLHLGAGPRLPTPHAVSAHGRTSNQHHFCDCSSCSSIRHECGG